MKNKKILIIILIVVSVLFLLSSGIFIYYNFFDKEQEDNKIKENTNNNGENIIEDRKQLSVENKSLLNEYPEIDDIYGVLHQKNWFFPDSKLITSEYYMRDMTKNTDLNNVLKVALVTYYEYDRDKIEEVSQLESTPYYSENIWNFDECVLNDNHNESVYKLGCGESLYIVFNIEKNQMDLIVNKYFGKDNLYEDTSINMGPCAVELRYNSNLGIYKLYSGSSCGGNGSLIYGYYSKIINIEKNDKDIYLYEKVLYTNINTTDNISIVNIYDIDDGTLVGNESYNSDFSIEEADKITYEYFKKYDEKLREYKYTFKQDEEGDYYFYSIEMIK